MDFLKINEVAGLWGLSERSVQTMCAEGKIEGAARFGRSWMIPKNALRPVDGRTRAGKRKREDILCADMPMPRETPFLYMTDLYGSAGSADEAVKALGGNPEAKALIEAEFAYSRGDIDTVYESANYLLSKHSGFYAILSTGMLLAMCAIWKGELQMWRRAKIHIAEAPAKSDIDRDAMQLAISAVDIMLYSVESFPEWFKSGCFEPLHRDALPAAFVYYAKYLYAVAYAVATGAVKVEGIQGLSLMSVIPNTIEPLISVACAQNSVMAEIYLRLTCAAVYHNGGNDEQAIRHIDKAIALAVADGLYGVLAEYCRVLDTLMEKRLAIVDPDGLGELQRLYNVYNEGWARLSGAVMGKNLITTLSRKEREVAKLAAFGMTNQEISDKLHLSLSVVKQSIRIVMEKSGMSRSEFAAIL